MAGLASVATELSEVVAEANSFEFDELEAVAEEQVEVVAATQRTVYSDTGDSIAELFVADIAVLTSLLVLLLIILLLLLRLLVVLLLLWLSRRMVCLLVSLSRTVIV